jgi:hypothetical protein
VGFLQKYDFHSYEVKEVGQQKFSEIGAEGWTNIYHQIQYIESTYYEQECLITDTAERRVMDDGCKDSSTSGSRETFEAMGEAEKLL